MLGLIFEYARRSNHSRPFLGVAPDTCVNIRGKSLTSVFGDFWTRSRLRAGSREALQQQVNGMIGVGSLDPVVCRSQYSVDRSEDSARCGRIRAMGESSFVVGGHAFGSVVESASDL